MRETRLRLKGGGGHHPTVTVSYAPTASFQVQVPLQRFCNRRLLLPNRFPNRGRPVCKCLLLYPVASVSFKRSPPLPLPVGPGLHTIKECLEGHKPRHQPLPKGLTRRQWPGSLRLLHR